MPGLDPSDPHFLRGLSPSTPPSAPPVKKDKSSQEAHKPDSTHPSSKPLPDTATTQPKASAAPRHNPAQLGSMGPAPSLPPTALGLQPAASSQLPKHPLVEASKNKFLTAKLASFTHGTLDTAAATKLLHGYAASLPDPKAAQGAWLVRVSTRPGQEGSWLCRLGPNNTLQQYRVQVLEGRIQYNAMSSDGSLKYSPIDPEMMKKGLTPTMLAQPKAAPALAPPTVAAVVKEIALLKVQIEMGAFKSMTDVTAAIDRVNASLFACIKNIKTVAECRDAAHLHGELAAAEQNTMINPHHVRLNSPLHESFRVIDLAIEQLKPSEKAELLKSLNSGFLLKPSLHTLGSIAHLIEKSTSTPSDDLKAAIANAKAISALKPYVDVNASDSAAATAQLKDFNVGNWILRYSSTKVREGCYLCMLTNKNPVAVANFRVKVEEGTLKYQHGSEWKNADMTKGIRAEERSATSQPAVTAEQMTAVAKLEESAAAILKDHADKTLLPTIKKMLPVYYQHLNQGSLDRYSKAEALALLGGSVENERKFFRAASLAFHPDGVAEGMKAHAQEFFKILAYFHNRVQ